MAKRTVIAPDEELLIKGKLVIQGNVTQIETTQLVNRLESDSLVINSDGDAVTAQLILNSDNELAVISFNSETGNIEVSKTIQGNIYIPDGATLSGNTFSGNASAADSLTSSVTISLSGDATGSNTFISAGTTTTVPVTLSTVNSNVGVFGNSGNVASINVSAKGLVTAVTQVPISILSSQVSDFNAAVSAYISTDTFLTESNGVISLNNTTVVAGSYGAANSALTLSINSKGQITSAVANNISILASQVSDFNTASNIAIDARVVGGNGLTYTSGNINVGAGSGITVNADNVSVDSTVVRTNSDATLGNNYIFTGTLDATAATATASTQANTDNSTKIATTAYVKTVINDLVNGANASLDTLREIADALANNTNIGTIVLNNEANIATLQGRNISAGNGLSGGGNLSADVTLSVGAGDGIIVDADNVSVDSTVVRTDGDFALTGNVQFTGSLRIPTVSSSLESAIYVENGAVFATVDGNAVQLTSELTVGTITSVGATGELILISIGDESKGIRRITSDNIYTNVTVSDNVITVAGNISGIRTGFSTSNVSGFGGLTYNSTTGVISHVGVSTAEIRDQISGTGLISYSNSTGVISTTADNYNSWKFTTDSAGNTDVASGNLVTFAAGSGIQISHENSTITITNSSTADITGVSAGNGLVGGGESGDVTLNVVGGYGITVNPDNVTVNNSEIQAQANAAFSNNTTTNLTEGTNLYFTAARARGNVSATTASGIDYNNTTGVFSLSSIPNSSLANNSITINGTAVALGGTRTLSTTDIAEGTNLYFTAARARGNVSAATASGIDYNNTTGVFSLSSIPNASLANTSITINGTAVALGGTRTLSTTDIAEGTNLYFTAARANTAIDTRLSGGVGITYTSGVIATANIPNSSLANTSITINGTAVALGGTRTLSTTDIAEGTNQYFTTARANSAMDAYLVGGNGLTYSSGTFAVGAGAFIIANAANIAVDATSTNTPNKVVVRDANGSFSANIITATATTARYADLAEKYLADSQYEPGTVLVFGGKYEVTVTDSELNHRVAGVVTTAPAHLMNDQLSGEFVVDVALRGRVPCKVVGKVQKGDVLVTSDVTGYARAAEHPQFTGSACIVGKAITEKTDSGLGVVEALI